jgi:mono/diheme cytochrome c family protein
VRIPRLAPLGALLLLAACGESPSSRPGPATGGNPDLGRQVYLGQCASCHASDPGQRGPVGPAVKGSSRELLEARLLRGTYPPGYTPKQATTVMQPMPHLAANLDDLAAYLR